ncbi:autotransporter assembly complex family protein [Nioella sp.]|uniref:autotransporter assembly complex protein TamA n=1 Tax=Nioella sp. TaxID=1912091 RepID=UPI0035186C3A
MRRLFLFALMSAGLACAGAAMAEVRLVVSGGSEDLAPLLRPASRLAATGDLSGLPAQDVVATARADYARLLARLYEMGYFGPVISIRLDGREASDISPFQTGGTIREAVISIDPGAPFRLGRADIAPLAPGTTLPEGFVPGAAAGTPVLRQAAEAGIAAWRSEGHAAATVADQRIVARHGESELDAQIMLDPGPVAQFGEVVPEGAVHMLPERIARIAGLPRGERFDPDTLDRVAGRLRDSGAFGSVGLVEGPIGPDGTLDITAELVEAPLRRLGFGAELSSTEGVMVSAYWLHRNLFGGAERLRFDAEISGLGGENGGFDAMASAQFARPATLTPDTTLELGATLEHLDEFSFQTDSLDLSAGLRHQFSPRLDGAIALEVSRIEIEDAFSERGITMLSLPTELTWDNRDNASDARGGQFVTATLTPFGMNEGGGGLRATFDTRAYLGFGETRSTRLALRLQGGTVEGGDIDDLPPDWLFFSGGAGTVRGQDYQSLGALQGGLATGGRSFVGSSLELRQDIVGNWGAVLFADIGYVTADALWSGSSDWHAGAGIGVRYMTGIGPVRVDLAAPVGGAASVSDLSLYIGIGQAF